MSDSASKPQNALSPTPSANGSKVAPKDTATVPAVGGATNVITPDNSTMIAPTASTPSGYDALSDPALISAWRRFLDYDRVSSTQKDQYLRIREWVIALYFLTSVLAIFSAMMQSSTLFSTFQQDLMRFSLVVLPIVSVALNTYGAQFASSTAWIEYRVGAETIRQKIYLYRMHAGEFGNLPNLQDRQRKLLEIINEADMRIDKANATLPYMEPLEKDNTPGNSIQDRVASKTDKRRDPKNPQNEYDDGFTQLPVHKYLDYRIRNQVDWYANRIQTDYQDMSRYRLAALVIASIGAVIAALGNGLEALVAVTTAAGVALNMRADSRMYGATYATYHLTASRLRNELNAWDILSREEQSEVARAADFVSRMEKILYDEREAWRSSAIELQSTADRSVNANIKTEGNQIATKMGMSNSVKDYPSLMDTTTVEAPSASADVSGALLTADTAPTVASTAGG